MKIDLAVKHWPPKFIRYDSNKGNIYSQKSVDNGYENLFLE